MTQEEYKCIVRPQIEQMTWLFNLYQPGENEDVDELRAEQRAYLSDDYVFSMNHRAMIIDYMNRYNKAVFMHEQKVSELHKFLNKK